MKKIDYEISTSIGQGRHETLLKLKNGGYVVKDEKTGGETIFCNNELEQAFKYINR